MEWVFIGLMYGSAEGGVIIGPPRSPVSVTLYVANEEKCRRVGDRFVSLSRSDNIKAKYECVFMGK